ncbi:hypothetical protein D3C75_905130 [compost metagenome]
MDDPFVTEVSFLGFSEMRSSNETYWADIGLCISSSSLSLSIRKLNSNASSKIMSSEKTKLYFSFLSSFSHFPPNLLSLFVFGDSNVTVKFENGKGSEKSSELTAFPPNF